MSTPSFFDQILDELDLVVLALAAEALERLLDRDVLARERLVGGDVLAHLRLDGLEVGVGEADAVGEVEVVVEAVLDRRPDGDLHARVEVHDRRGEHVGGVVADEVERVLPAAIGDDLQRLVGLQRLREVAQLAVLLDGQGGARQPRADRSGGVGAAGALGKLERRAIGEGDLHRSRCYASARPQRQFGGEANERSHSICVDITKAATWTRLLQLVSGSLSGRIVCGEEQDPAGTSRSPRNTAPRDPWVARSPR